jgi:sterol desaturase/sphingolipid hydroxylase (fatty acid hydroxylase superfamily)
MEKRRMEAPKNQYKGISRTVQKGNNLVYAYSSPFSVIGALTAVLWQKGYTQLYTDLHWYDIVWFPCSIVISMLIHETYYYWIHRWMHHPKIYHLVHKVHHDSKITSAWTAFSFHPIEGLLEALIMPAIICIIPMHIYAATVHLTIMTITAAINHLDIEIYPKTKWGNWLGNNDWSHSP